MTEGDIAALVSQLKTASSLSMGAKYTPAAANIFVNSISHRVRAIPYSLK